MYVFLAILIGFVASVLAGMFGVGGAGITTPAIRVILGVSPAIALGTTLPVAIPTALVGAYTYDRQGFLDWRLAAFCSAGGVFGSVGGAYLTKFVDLHYLMLLTGALVLYLSVTTIYKGVTGRVVEVEAEKLTPDEIDAEAQVCEDEPEKRGPKWRLPPVPASYIGIGLIAGFFSGLLGVGGGIVLVPSFLYLLCMPIKKAFGTSLAVIAVISIPGTVVHALLGHISGWLFLFLVIGVVPGAYIGAKLAIKAKVPVLYAGFGALLGVFGIVFIVNEIISMAG